MCPSPSNWNNRFSAVQVAAVLNWWNVRRPTQALGVADVDVGDHPLVMWIWMFKNCATLFRNYLVCTSLCIITGKSNTRTVYNWHENSSYKITVIPLTINWEETRLISIESQPKEIVVVVVIGVIHVVVVVIPVVDSQNIPLKFGWNQVINRWDVVDVVVISVVVVVVVAPLPSWPPPHDFQKSSKNDKIII